MLAKKAKKKKVGRPPKYSSVQEFQERIQTFFLYCKENKKLPTKGNLATYLDVVRDTLCQWEKPAHPFSDTLKKTYEIIEDSWVQELHGNSVAGIIFYLKNAFGFRDRQETDITTAGDKVSGVIVLPQRENENSLESTTKAGGSIKK